MKTTSLSLILNFLVPGLIYGQSLQIDVSDKTPDSRSVEVQLKADAAARVFAPQHSGYPRFLAMKQKSEILGIHWQEETSFDSSLAIYTVTSPTATSRVYRDQHPYLGFWESFSLLGAGLSELKRNGTLTLDKIGLEKDTSLPGLKFTFPESIGGRDIGTLSSRFILCSLPVLGRSAIPHHLADAIENRGLCSDDLSSSMLTLMQATTFRIESETPAASPDLESLSFFANFCTLSIDPVLAQPAIASFIDSGWIPASYDLGHGTQDAARFCKIHVLTEIIPALQSNFATFLENYMPELPSSSEFLNHFIEEISEEAVSGPADPKKYVQDQLFQNLLPLLLDPAHQGLPLFIPMRDYNATELRKALLKSKGEWASQSDLIDALFTPPPGSKSVFFAYLTAASEDRRDSIKASLGGLYFSRCDRTQPITVECVNSSAVAIEQYRVFGLSPDAASYAAGFGTINFGPF
ncbi:MAG TPA: hypothetical protein VE954_32515 [Oligoflexus sp.]|uniref:hypothetical protein n=1 Tax=Oligoflexus sp. TaxID=1971216 RepID=UPI002D4E5F44|nr:hypothetical protein [Oligoflexus sp.]HYX37852.1 hypothetical protein [Oligoflexus sp.]